MYNLWMFLVRIIINSKVRSLQFIYCIYFYVLPTNTIIHGILMKSCIAHVIRLEIPISRSNISLSSSAVGRCLGLRPLDRDLCDEKSSPDECSCMGTNRYVMWRVYAITVELHATL